MSHQNALDHIAVTYTNKEQATRFFRDVLELSHVKSFELSASLSQAIFAYPEEVMVEVFANDVMKVEVFITDRKAMFSFHHFGLSVPDKQRFIDRCHSHGLKPFTVRKGTKDLLFVRDEAGNLYEIKEKKE